MKPGSRPPYKRLSLSIPPEMKYPHITCNRGKRRRCWRAWCSRGEGPEIYLLIDNNRLNTALRVISRNTSLSYGVVPILHGLEDKLNLPSGGIAWIIYQSYFALAYYSIQYPPHILRGFESEQPLNSILFSRTKDLFSFSYSIYPRYYLLKSMLWSPSLFGKGPS